MTGQHPPSGVSLARHVVHLADDLGVRLCGSGDGFWDDTRRPELAEGRLVSVFTYAAAWEYQERHTVGDELVYVLDGEVDLLLEAGDGERSQRLARGDAGVVPAGSWHRVAPHGAATLLFVTPLPAMTEHRPLRAG